MSRVVRTYSKEEFFSRNKKSKYKPEAYMGSYAFFTCRINKRRKCFVVDESEKYLEFHRLEPFEYMQLVGMSKDMDSLMEEYGDIDTVFNIDHGLIFVEGCCN